MAVPSQDLDCIRPAHGVTAVDFFMALELDERKMFTGRPHIRPSPKKIVTRMLTHDLVAASDLRVWYVKPLI